MRTARELNGLFGEGGFPSQLVPRCPLVWQKWSVLGATLQAPRGDPSEGLSVVQQ